jgi:Ca2+-binding RTX toxin-like protein
MPNIYGTNNDDVINASDGVTNGNDVIYGYGGDDFIWGLDGDDYIYGGLGNDFLNGGNGNDTLVGDTGSNQLIGGAGNDKLISGSGADFLDGGTGTNMASYQGSWEGVVVNLVSGEGSGGTAEGDTLVNIHKLSGSGHADVLLGDDGYNMLAGVGGDDSLIGGGGGDLLLGGSGNDTLKGGGGADTLNGESGIDTVSYFGSTTGVRIELLSGTGENGEAEGDVLSNIENVTGSSYDDMLAADDGANVLFGMNGFDWLVGYGGNDVLHGGGGNDMLVGGTGKDLMYGDSGLDRFVFQFTSEAPALGYGNTDYIPDFSQADGDKIELDLMDADTTVAGTQDFSFIGNGVAFSGVAGELRFNTYYGFVEGDVNGDAVADFQIELDIVSMSASDFIL